MPPYPLNLSLPDKAGTSSVLASPGSLPKVQFQYNSLGSLKYHSIPMHTTAFKFHKYLQLMFIVYRNAILFRTYILSSTSFSTCGPPLSGFCLFLTIVFSHILSISPSHHSSDLTLKGLLSPPSLVRFVCHNGTCKTK